jgi:hypothetical protein
MSTDILEPNARGQASPNDVDLRELTDQLIASRTRLADIEHLRIWNTELRHRLWLAVTVGLGLDIESQRALDNEIALYRAAVALIEEGAI